MHVTYHVGEHDGGWAYHIEEVWSDRFPDHRTALEAARVAASRQGTSEEDVLVSYQNAEGNWTTELAGNGERVDAEVMDVGPPW